MNDDSTHVSVILDRSGSTEIPELTLETYVPRASTPLLDAIGRSINDLEQQIASMKVPQRPSRVVTVVISGRSVTDGNSCSSVQTWMRSTMRSRTGSKQLRRWRMTRASGEPQQSGLHWRQGSRNIGGQRRSISNSPKQIVTNSVVRARGRNIATVVILPGPLHEGPADGSPPPPPLPPMP